MDSETQSVLDRLGKADVFADTPKETHDTMDAAAAEIARLSRAVEYWRGAWAATMKQNMDAREALRAAGIDADARRQYSEAGNG